jgi:hypothetical protein
MKWHENTMVNIDKVWTTYIEGLEQSLDMLDRDIREAKDMAKACTNEWCTATEHILDDLSNSVFSIHEPVTSKPERSQRIKALRRRIHDIYADYRSLPRA